MKRTAHRIAGTVLGSLMVLFCGAICAEPSGKWRIVLDNRAGNDGTIVLRVAPVGGTPIDVETKVPESTSENHVATLLRDSLKVSLGKGYSIETDDGEDVLIKKRGKTPKFELSLVSSSLTGLEVKIRRD